MGSVCGVASRGRTHSNRNIGSEIMGRNISNSPSWTSRWDNQGVSRNASMELKGPLGSERGYLSDTGSSLENFGSPISQKSAVHGRTVTHWLTSHTDLSVASNHSPKVKNLAESSGVIESPAPNPFSMPSAFSTPISDPLPTTNHPFFPNSTPSRLARRSPGHQLLRQVSDSRVLGLKSPNNNSVSEGRPSFVLSTCSNDLVTGFHGGSSDGWSMRTFSELVASSQRERWSFDSEQLGFTNGKIGESSSRFSCSPSIDVQYCRVCSKLLSERSSWGGPELSVASVLVCGHIYHAECLDTMTPEANKYDPPCPICMAEEKQLSKISRKASRSEIESKSKNRKISKNRVVDSCPDSDFDVFGHQKNTDGKGKCPRMEPSSSTKSSSAKPFLKRHFSLQCKRSSFLSENDSSKKKGFWARYRKD